MMVHLDVMELREASVHSGAPVAPDIVIFVSAKAVRFANIISSWCSPRIAAYCLCSKVT
jgi:hypothetical protein